MASNSLIMNRKITLLLLSLGFFLIQPFTAFAEIIIPALPSNNLDISIVLDNILTFLVWPIFGTFAIAMFIFAGVQFFTAKGEPGKLATARTSLIWGMVGLAVALLASTIPFIVKNILNI